MRNFLLAISFLFLFISETQAQHSVAREWNEVMLAAIRNDFARPTIHARNLWHTSMGMYDAWAIFDDEAETFLLGKTVSGFNCNFNGFPTPQDIEAAREEAISYVAYRLLTYRFQSSPGASTSIVEINNLMATLGYDSNFTSLDYSTGSAAALGNYIADCIINFGLQDNSNEALSYTNQSYSTSNPPLVTDFPGNPDMVDPNRWQPLTLDVFIDQSGNPIPINTPDFLSPEWGNVVPFALKQEDLTIYQRGGFDYWVYHDPGTPPLLDETGADSSDDYKWGFSLVSVWSSHLDPADGEMIDISPASIGNIQNYPSNISDYPSFYNLIEGGDPSIGHSINPATGLPYTPQIVPRADYARVLAEFWADGPDSETPPGHWFTILNYVNDHPLFEKKFKGNSEIVDDLEWDVKAYFTMGGAMHDCAITAWGIKGWYDYPRPISAIRYMADKGQSSDPSLPNYDLAGIPLIPDYIELVEAGDPLVGSNNEHLNKIKLYAWKGPDYINNPDTDIAGVDWILAENWFPYQRPSFVTPPFAGYVSGHSTYSRAAAEVMTLLTGDEFFPGGLGEFQANQNEFLVFEEGPSVDIILQWATYRDASDQTSLSRIWGGIHPPADDVVGRLIGMEIGVDAFNLAEDYFFRDNDNDGFYSYEDCDDNNPNIYPNAPELCDAFDNDCNGLLNDGITTYTYYEDNDADGFGNQNIFIDTCGTIAPKGYVSNSGDCNDNNPNINPSAIEICDGLDNNCNGLINDGLSINTYFIDNDNDGFGNANIPIDTCLAVAPLNYVNNNLDCNDNDPNINPDAMEICDGLDNNCNGLINDGLSITTYFIDNDNDGFGNPNISMDTCLTVAPLNYANNNLDCNDNDELINPNANDIPDNGIDEDCTGEDLYEQLNYFPNPTNGMLNIRANSNENVLYQIYDISGKLVQEGNLKFAEHSAKLNIGSLLAGVYILQLLNPDGSAFTSNSQLNKIKIIKI